MGTQRPHRNEPLPVTLTFSCFCSQCFCSQGTPVDYQFVALAIASIWNQAFGIVLASKTTRARRESVRLLIHVCYLPPLVSTDVRDSPYLFQTTGAPRPCAAGLRVPDAAGTSRLSPGSSR